MEFMLFPLAGLIGLVVVALLSCEKRGNQPRTNPGRRPPPPLRRS
jgi:hypothetical protein